MRLQYGIFGLEFYKTVVIFEISTLKFVYFQHFGKKTKMPKLEPKMPYLGILRLEFQISTLKFVYLQNFAKKQECLNFGPKVFYLGIFGLEF